MLTLAINTAAPRILIAITEGKKILARASWQSKADESKKLLAGIVKLLKKNRLRWKNLDRIFVCCGPGTFSALRIGVTVANTLSFILKIPLYELAPQYWKFPSSTSRLKKIKIGIPKYSLPPNITKSKIHQIGT